MIHQLDPRIKIIIGLLFVYVVFQAQSPYSLTMIALLLSVWTWQSEIPIHYLLNSIRPFRWVLSLTFLFHACLSSGPWIADWVPFTSNGIQLGFLTVFRITVLLLATGLFSLTTSPQKLVNAMNFFAKPLEWLGLPSGLLGFVMATGLRFIPLLMLEVERILKAQVARGIPLEYGTIWQRAQGYVAVAVPLFIRLFLSSEHIASAMESRCFNLHKPRTNLYPIHITWQDILYGSLVCILLIAVAWVC